MTEIREPVDLHLTAEEFNLVLAGLEGLPYRSARPVIDEISRQVIRQIEAAQSGLLATGN